MVDMQDQPNLSQIPVPEKDLRTLAKTVVKILPDLAGQDPVTGVNKLNNVLSPILETADLANLESGHRAAASNALCAIIEHAWASGDKLVQNAILDDAVWLRILEVYLQRSGNAKGKSMKQLLVVLSNIVVQDDSARSKELQQRAAASFLGILSQRQDRVTVKPALQGLAHFLLKDVVSVDQLVGLRGTPPILSENEQPLASNPQTLFELFLAWVVHHDTSLAAGHVVKNFLLRARNLPEYWQSTDDGTTIPLWIIPVVQTFKRWPDRMQELRTHVFPHCFLPALDEYLCFLSFLHFETHIGAIRHIPKNLISRTSKSSGLDGVDEFSLLLAVIASGKELSIVREHDFRRSNGIEIHDGALYLPDDISGTWMSHTEPTVRLAGMFLSVYSVSITRPFTSGVLRALKRNLVHLHTETDADFRREVLGYTQKLFDRLRASTATSAKRKTGVKLSSSRSMLPQHSSMRERKLLRTKSLDADLEPLQFISWFIGFLEWELRPTSSYQRRIVALRSMIVCLRSGLDPGVPRALLSKSAQGDLNWAHRVQVATPNLVRTLLDLILDPFDDIRDAAVSALQLCLITLPRSQAGSLLESIPTFLNRAEETMFRTGRADHADGVARAYGMIYSTIVEGETPGGSVQPSSRIELFEELKTQLENTLSVAYNSLAEAVEGRPVHGIFAAVRYVIDQDEFYPKVLSSSNEDFARWKNLHSNILTCIESLWACVNHVLCADAPEGHVPDEVEEDARLDTREILSYSWRALKEASTLLRSIVTRAPIGQGEDDFVTPELFEQFGKLCFTQLLELRHRGAFSTVSQTFVAFCRRCSSSKISSLQSLPDMWYQETLRSIQAKSDAITRRSAGIPAAMTALLAAEQQVGGPFFQRAFSDLVAETLVEAKSTNIGESRLPQVHALNCIKEIFTTSRLSVASEAYIGSGLDLAAKTLNSKIWPLRNCSLMLFKALIERLLGSDEAQDWKDRDRAKTSRFSYESYPTLPDTLTNLLDPVGPLKKSLEAVPEGSSPFDLHGAEGVFPALQILRQARPPDSYLSSIRHFVVKLFASPHWHLREMAARTFVALHHSSELTTAAVARLAEYTVEHNTQHGTLLAVKYMITNVLRDSSQINAAGFQSLITALTTSARTWYAPNDCGFVRSTFLDIVSRFGMAILERADGPQAVSAWIKLTESVSIGSTYSLKIRHSRGNELLRNSIARVYFIDRVILREDAITVLADESYQTIEAALASLARKDPDTCCVALETLGDILRLHSHNGTSIPLCLVVAYVHQVVLQATDAEVISKAQSVLANALDHEGLKADFFSIVSEQRVMPTLSKLEQQCLEGAPSNMQTGLRLLGPFLDFALDQYPEHMSTILHAIARYIRLLRITLIDTNPFDTRLATVQSIAELKHIWTLPCTSRSSAPLLLGLAFILFDLLTDDDDEIRALAALATGTFLRSQDQNNYLNTVPLLTTQHLAAFLSRTFPSNPALRTESLRRLTNTPLPNPLFSLPFSEVIAEESKHDSALFAREKQNLYKDDVLDSLCYSRMLSSLSPTSIPQSTSLALRNWVLDALSVLTRKAETERDGALGWSTKPEVFALGMRVFCAAEVVLRWEGKGVGEGRREVLVALRRFVDTGLETEVHGLWMQRVEEVLEREVWRAMVRVKKSLLSI